MGYDINALTDGCYEGTTCLVNKFNVRDSEKLGVIESQITLAKISMLHQTPIKGKFDFEHYKAIHRFLFEDLYDWAGTVRKVNMSKKGHPLPRRMKSKALQRLALTGWLKRITLRV